MENKEELINAIAEKIGHSKVDTKNFLDNYIEVVQDALTKGDSVQLVGFATLSVGDRAERKGRNPQTGKELIIPASKVVKFSAGKQLKDAVNNNKVSNKNQKPAKATAAKKKK